MFVFFVRATLLIVVFAPKVKANTSYCENLFFLPIPDSKVKWCRQKIILAKTFFYGSLELLLFIFLHFWFLCNKDIFFLLLILVKLLPRTLKIFQWFCTFYHFGYLPRKKKKLLSGLFGIPFVSVVNPRASPLEQFGLKCFVVSTHGRLLLDGSRTLFT